MSDQICCEQNAISRKKGNSFPLVRFILKLLRAPLARKRVRLYRSDLTPELRKDIGFEEPPRGISSLDQKWQEELDRRLR